MTVIIIYRPTDKWNVVMTTEDRYNTIALFLVNSHQYVKRVLIHYKLLGG